MKIYKTDGRLCVVETVYGWHVCLCQEGLNTPPQAMSLGRHTVAPWTDEGVQYVSRPVSQRAAVALFVKILRDEADTHRLLDEMDAAEGDAR